MILLQTFGGPVVFHEDGHALVGAAAQRRTLALLSLLAVAGPAGISRDKLVGILWPDVGPKRARHSLTQALYAARKALDCEDLVEGTEDIRLNPNRINSDISGFEEAFATDDDAAAAALYRGPFLDGFYLSSSDFERWADAQRATYEERVVAALNRLVARAEADGDPAAAVGWLRKLAAIRPSDSTVALRLMHALAGAGDPAAAVQRAELHSRILREEFELDTHPDVQELAETLRALPPRRDRIISIFHTPPAESQASPVVQQLTDLPPKSDYVLPVRYDPFQRELNDDDRHRKPFRNRAVAAAVGVLLTVLFVVFSNGRDPSTTHAFQQSIVVAPFRVVGASAALDYLREGMVELLSNRLADDTVAQPVDAGSVLRTWRRAGITKLSDPPRDSLVNLAAKLGAEHVIVGSVVGTPARAVLSATVIKARSGQVRGEATVEGPTDSLLVLVDRLASQLLISQTRREQPLADRFSSSLPALRSFLSGMSAQSNGDFAVAAARFERALRTDSTFALAAFRLALASHRLSDFAAERRALLHAWRFKEALSEPDRAHLSALLGPSYPGLSRRVEVTTAWEAAARVLPNRADVWFGFAAHIVRDNAGNPQGHQLERAGAALDRALELDPAHAPARLLLFRIAGRLQRIDGTDSMLIHAPINPISPFLRWRLAARSGDTATLRRFTDSLSTIGPVNLRTLIATAQFDAMRSVDALKALTALQSRSQSSAHDFDLLIAEHSLALNRGHTNRALELTSAIQRSSPATRTHFRLRVLDGIYAELDSAIASDAVVELERSVQQQSRSAAADACTLAQWYLSKSDTAAARVMWRVLQSAPSTEPLAIDVPAPACSRLVDVWLAVASRRADASASLVRFDSLDLAPGAVGDLATFGNLAVSRLFRHLGEPALALEAIRRRPYLSGGWPRYLMTSLREEGELLQSLGDLNGAIAAYSRFLELRIDPDSTILPVVTAVRDSLNALHRRVR